MMLRLANKSDITQLGHLKWQALQEYTETNDNDKVTFQERYGAFLLMVLTNPDWKIWLAEQNGHIIGHIYAQRVVKEAAFGEEAKYLVKLSNFYTTPVCRKQGILQTLFAAVMAWLQSHQYEYTIINEPTMSIG